MFGNYFRSELYRASKMKCTYILVAVLFFYSIFSTFLLTNIDFSSVLGVSDDELQTLNEEGHDIDAFQTGVDSGITISSTMYDDGIETTEIQILGRSMYYNCDLLELYQQNLMSALHFLLISLFIGIYFGSIYRTGFDKNILISNNNRFTLFLARFAVTAVYGLVMMFTEFISTLISDPLFTHEVTLDFSGNFLIYLAIAYLLLLAFASVIVAFTVVTRSTAAGNTAGVFLSLGTANYLFVLLNAILIGYFSMPEDIDLQFLTISQNISTLAIDATSFEFTRAAVVAVVYLVLSILSSYIVIKKRDVN